MSIYGPIITTADIEDAVRATLRRWLDTMLGEVERQSDERWDLRQIARPRSWQLVTDYQAPTADRRLPCVAIEAGPEERTNSADGWVNANLGLSIIVIAKGQDREKTRETLAGLVTGLLMVLEKHGDMDGFAVGTAIGDITRDAISPAKSKTIAGATIPISVLVDHVANRWGGPSEPDAPPPTDLPEESPDYPAHTSTTVAVAYKED